jgi:hypothetical protein
VSEVVSNLVHCSTQAESKDKGPEEEQCWQQYRLIFCGGSKGSAIRPGTIFQASHSGILLFEALDLGRVFQRKTKVNPAIRAVHRARVILGPTSRADQRVHRRFPYLNRLSCKRGFGLTGGQQPQFTDKRIQGSLDSWSPESAKDLSGMTEL